MVDFDQNCGSNFLFYILGSHHGYITLLIVENKQTLCFCYNKTFIIYMLNMIFYRTVVMVKSFAIFLHHIKEMTKLVPKLDSSQSCQLPCSLKRHSKARQPS